MGAGTQCVTGRGRIADSLSRALDESRVQSSTAIQEVSNKLSSEISSKAVTIRERDALAAQLEEVLKGTEKIHVKAEDIKPEIKLEVKAEESLSDGEFLYIHLFNLDVLPTARRRLGEPLLSTTLFRQFNWTTEFFQTSTRLDSLLSDPALLEFLPFIKRLNYQNEAGLDGLGWSWIRTGPNNALPTWVWGYILRFLVLDMLLRLKGYKIAVVVKPDGTKLPKGVATFTRKLFKWEKYLGNTAAMGEGNPADAIQGCENLRLTALSILSVIEEPSLPSPGLASETSNAFVPPRFSEASSATEEAATPDLTQALVNRYLAIWLFISPLAILVENELSTPSKVTYEQIFLRSDTERATAANPPSNIFQSFLWLPLLPSVAFLPGKASSGSSHAWIHLLRYVLSAPTAIHRHN
ncbi:hypothetical protein FB45DRAFT_1024486 [Roridomyces roridus]|uniref:Uncharacterized protein n=1 Tax=Roridomyces roridus TaxID=1738132 RepID=A0AAD7C149_9AGAR|nr:hypothetical protein FB45DRAFT_1024486 [Roridomyces roridus]